VALDLMVRVASISFIFTQHQPQPGWKYRKTRRPLHSRLMVMLTFGQVQRGRLYGQQALKVEQVQLAALVLQAQQVLQGKLVQQAQPVLKALQESKTAQHHPGQHHPQ
jgi:hypothetical protein